MELLKWSVEMPTREGWKVIALLRHESEANATARLLERTHGKGFYAYRVRKVEA